MKLSKKLVPVFVVSLMFLFMPLTASADIYVTVNGDERTTANFIGSYHDGGTEIFEIESFDPATGDCSSGDKIRVEDGDNHDTLTLRCIKFIAKNLTGSAHRDIKLRVEAEFDRPPDDTDVKMYTKLKGQFIRFKNAVGNYVKVKYGFIRIPQGTHGSNPYDQVGNLVEKEVLGGNPNVPGNLLFNEYSPYGGDEKDLSSADRTQGFEVDIRLHDDDELLLDTGIRVTNNSSAGGPLCRTKEIPITSSIGHFRSGNDDCSRRKNEEIIVIRYVQRTFWDLYGYWWK